MRRAAAFCALAAAALCAGETPVKALDPAREADRERLLEIVRTAAQERNDAARKLAKAGHVEELLAILRTTEVYNAMQAVTGALGERSVEVMEERLRAEPDNPYLVGALRPPTDPRVTRLLLRALDSRDRRTVMAAAHGLVFAADVDGLRDTVRRRFDAVRDEALRAKLAVCLVRHGDADPVAWLRERLQDRSYDALESLAYVADSREPFPFEDASILAPLLPDLIALVGDPSRGQDARRTLRRLTRHDFGEATEWRAFVERAPHPIYTKALDDALRACAEAFREKVHALDRNLDVSPAPGFDAVDGCVKIVENVPKSIVFGSKWEDGTPIRQPEFPIRLLVTLQTDARAATFVTSWKQAPSVPAPVEAERRFDRINVVARLYLGEGGGKEKREAVVEAARAAWEVLARYEREAEIRPVNRGR